VKWINLAQNRGKLQALKNASFVFYNHLFVFLQGLKSEFYLVKSFKLSAVILLARGRFIEGFKK